MWYTRDTSWNGTFSTYSYNWTSGDRFGFAPVTITAGAELLTGPDPTASGGGSDSGGGRTRGGPAMGAVVVWVGVMAAVVMVGLGIGLGG